MLYQCCRNAEKCVKVFRKSLSTRISRQEMPSGEELKELSKKLPGRTVAQIRTKIHNIISGKLKKY